MGLNERLGRRTITQTQFRQQDYHEIRHKGPSVEGTFHQVKGKVKDFAGKVSMNPRPEAEGKDENSKGEVQENIGQVKKLVGK